MKLTTGQRAVVLALVALAALASLLYAKYAALPLFLDHRGIGGTVLLAGLLAIVALAAWRLDATLTQVASIAAPLFLILLVSIVVTPLPYELEHQALALPHPAGESAPPSATRAPTFDAGHPFIVVTFSYPPGRNVTQLATESISALQAAGWRTFEPTLPGGYAGSYAILSAERSGLLVSCTIGERGASASTGPTSQCSLSVQ